MRNITQLAVSLALLATQVNIPSLGLGDLAAAAPVPNQVATVYEVKLDTSSSTPVQLIGSAQPDYNTQVLAPLVADQAAVAAKAKAKTLAAAKLAAARVVKPVVVAGSDVWASLRYCEAGGDYTRNSGNGFYGAYQFDIGTWASYDGYARPDLAPPAVQDAKAKATQAARGWAPWPACARKLGLL